MTDGFVWIDPPDEVFAEGVDAYLRSVKAGVIALAERRAPEIEAWMKANAPWTDRTGNARQTLHTTVEVLIGEVVIAFEHGVGYGRFLELAHGGRYAIIGPALDQFAPLIWHDVEQLLRT